MLIERKMLLRVVMTKLIRSSIPGNPAGSRAREFLLIEVDPAEYQTDAYERAQPQDINMQETRLGCLLLREALTLYPNSYIHFEKKEFIYWCRC